MPTVPSPVPPQLEHYVTPPLTVIFTVLFLILIFVGFFTLYFCKCFLDTIVHAWRIHHHNGETETTENPLQPHDEAPPPVNPGLDLRIINSFPTFPYFSVKDLREEKYGLECAICLLEFDGDHVLRLLTTCYHVFHQECIDLWFESHKTCPVCRHDLDPPPPPENTSNVLSNVDEMIIDVVQETSYADDRHQTTTPNDTCTSSGQSSCANNERSRKEQTSPEIFSRSHSTGHSIVRNKLPEEEDKYTLRLPEHVKINVTRGHSQTKSCVTFAELVRNRSYDHRRFGEVSNQTLATHSGK
ncbi:RING-H2 finger protein ATL29 [Raphanus sativus]|uniref:RING-type E3 ubiquitin transferase n=1 Tax=Raphanus sativus TaxID=3726 RepID=A0A6J0NC59_RAPSA|nr:RING-H2 finger protein ATL29-like [Raphanus sativus]KAJ4899976.1 RING-H2 finger protein ATL29 [Raphanus sativus]